MKDGHTEAPRLFCSYSSRDEAHLNRLLAHLSLLKRENRISEWHDRQIHPGDDWDKSIMEQLERARIILFLVSADFIASDYIWGKEVRRALQRNDRNEATVVPVIVNPVDWQTAPFGRLQALPTDGRPVTRWGNRDQAWADVAGGLRSLIDRL